jgi:hypothetical protein
MTNSIADFWCDKPTHSFGDRATCAHCGTATKESGYECGACKSTSPTAGPCDDSSCATKPLRTRLTYCDKPRHRHGPPCPGYGKATYYCPAHDYVDTTTGNCGTCGTEKIQANFPRKANLVDAAPTGGGPLADAPGSYSKITRTRVQDHTSPTGKKDTYTKTTVASTPKQTDYFKANGKIVVYDPLDLPKPGVV